MEILEIEIKARCDDLEECIRRAVGMGAAETGIFHEADMYFNHPAKDFGVTDEALRVRSSGDRVLLTYKGPKLSARAKTRVEHEVQVENSGTTRSILELLGFVLFGTVRKVRRVYILGDVHICFDSVENLGTFVELEKMGADREPVEKELFELAARLGLDRFERKSYLELLACR